jgi:hypothetical protein
MTKQTQRVLNRRLPCKGTPTLERLIETRQRLLFSQAIRRARRRGIRDNIQFQDMVWPTHCPVLGIKIDYLSPEGFRARGRPDLPSIDRIDASRGYVKGNVYVISARANRIKSNATIDEIRALLGYMELFTGLVS